MADLDDHARLAAIPPDLYFDEDFDDWEELLRIIATPPEMPCRGRCARLRQGTRTIFDVLREPDRDLLYFMNQRRQAGAGTRPWKKADLSRHFHLSLVDAAKMLGVSQKTLKSPMKKFALRRRPGPQVKEEPAA